MLVGPCALKGGQYCHYGLMLSHSPVIVEDARLEIGDTVLTLISQMLERACRLPCYV